MTTHSDAKYNRKWRKANPAKNKANYDRANAKRTLRYAVLRVEALKMYGGECNCCGEKRVEFLAFDHRKGGGRKHRHEVAKGNSYMFVLWLLKTTRKGIRVLCHNCNCAHGFYGYCPHDKE